MMRVFRAAGTVRSGYVENCLIQHFNSVSTCSSLEVKRFLVILSCTLLGNTKHAGHSECRKLWDGNRFKPQPGFLEAGYADGRSDRMFPPTNPFRKSCPLLVTEEQLDPMYREKPVDEFSDDPPSCASFEEAPTPHGSVITHKVMSQEDYDKVDEDYTRPDNKARQAIDELEGLMKGINLSEGDHQSSPVGNYWICHRCEKISRGYTMICQTIGCHAVRLGHEINQPSQEVADDKKEQIKADSATLPVVNRQLKKVGEKMICSVMGKPLVSTDLTLSETWHPTKKGAVSVSDLPFPQFFQLYDRMKTEHDSSPMGPLRTTAVAINAIDVEGAPSSICPKPPSLADSGGSFDETEGMYSSDGDVPVVVSSELLAAGVEECYAMPREANTEQSNDINRHFNVFEPGRESHYDSTSMQMPTAPDNLSSFERAFGWRGSTVTGSQRDSLVWRNERSQKRTEEDLDCLVGELVEDSSGPIGYIIEDLAMEISTDFTSRTVQKLQQFLMSNRSPSKEIYAGVVECHLLSYQPCVTKCTSAERIFEVNQAESKALNPEVTQSFRDGETYPLMTVDTGFTAWGIGGANHLLHAVSIYEGVGISIQCEECNALVKEASTQQKFNQLVVLPIAFGTAMAKIPFILNTADRNARVLIGIKALEPLEISAACKVTKDGKKEIVLSSELDKSRKTVRRADGAQLLKWNGIRDFLVLLKKHRNILELNTVDVTKLDDSVILGDTLYASIDDVATIYKDLCYQQPEGQVFATNGAPYRYAHEFLC